MRTDFSKNPLVMRAIEFSLMAIKYVEVLEAGKKYTIANQLLRCATSIGANVMEAQSAESKQDFIHKLKIADKEAHETWYWFYLCERSEGYAFNKELSTKLDEIMRLLNAIILKAKNNLNKN
jgi:four helix bundle protein